MLTHLVTAPSDTGHPVQHRVAAILDGGPLADQIRAAGVKVDIVGDAGSRTLPRAVFGIAKVIRNWRPDAVQGWLYYGDLAALVARSLAPGTKPRLYWSIRCSDLDMGRHGLSLRVARWLWTRLSARPDAIIANSRAGLAAHRDLGIRPRAAAVIRNGTDADKFTSDKSSRTTVRSELGIADSAPVAVHLARVDPQKDHALLVAVAERLPQVTFVAAGRGTKQLSGPANLIGLGERADAPALLGAGDVVLSTSAYGEGYPNAVAEGMACGLPAVSTHCGDVETLIGPCGHIVRRGDVDAFADAVESIVGLPATERLEMGRAARARIVARFREADAIARFSRLYATGDLPTD